MFVITDNCLRVDEDVSILFDVETVVNYQGESLYQYHDRLRGTIKTTVTSRLISIVVGSLSLLNNTRKFYIRKNDNEDDSIEIGSIVIVNLLPWSDLEEYTYNKLFQLMMIKFYRHSLIHKYNFTCSLFWTTRKLTIDIKII